MPAVKNMIFAVVGTAVVLGSIGATFAHERGDRRGNMPKFEKLDANTDGKIDFIEFQRPLVDRFDQVDENKDGIISQNEGDKFADSRREKRMIQRVTMRFDIDQNNEVTKVELENRQKKMFALADINDDGILSKDEMSQRFAGHRGGGKRK
ncbi:MAG: acid-shock protein [Ahrensia sp.]|nr:acid-shock protein [Ahrensia sp.]